MMFPKNHPRVYLACALTAIGATVLTCLLLYTDTEHNFYESRQLPDSSKLVIFSNWCIVASSTIGLILILKSFIRSQFGCFDIFMAILASPPLVCWFFATMFAFLCKCVDDKIGCYTISSPLYVLVLLYMHILFGFVVLGVTLIILQELHVYDFHKALYGYAAAGRCNSTDPAYQHIDKTSYEAIDDASSYQSADSSLPDEGNDADDEHD